MDRVTGLLLAGGQAKRMGSINKGAVQLNDRPFAELVIGNLSKQVDDIVISANEYASYFKPFGFEVIKDKREGFLGPLAGIESAFIEIPDIQWLFCATVDTPFFPGDLVSVLLKRLRITQTLCNARPQRPKVSSAFSDSCLTSSFFIYFSRFRGKSGWLLAKKMRSSGSRGRSTISRFRKH